jgi:hypothetical protein
VRGLLKGCQAVQTFKPFKSVSELVPGSFRRAEEFFSPASGVIEYNIPNPKDLRHIILSNRGAPGSAAVMKLIA